AGHAQPRIAIDVVGVHQGAGQFVEGVVVLGQQLAGNVEGHAVRAVRGDSVREHRDGVVQCGAPVGAAAGQGFTQAQLRVQGAGVDIAGQVQGRALAAKPAEIGRMVGVALYAEDALAVVFDKHAAADTTVATGRSGDSGLGRHDT